jgi:hypothetical protein
LYLLYKFGFNLHLILNFDLVIIFLQSVGLSWGGFLKVISRE